MRCTVETGHTAVSVGTITLLDTQNLLTMENGSHDDHYSPTALEESV